MMGEVAKLVDATDSDARSWLPMTAPIKALLDQKIIAKQPSGAYTTAITDKL